MKIGALHSPSSPFTLKIPSPYCIEAPAARRLTSVKIATAFAFLTLCKDAPKFLSCANDFTTFVAAITSWLALTSACS